MKNLFAVALVFTALSASFISNTAQAAGKCKPISRLPVEITVSGVYCLKKNLSYIDSAGASITSGNVITISAPDTVLDLEGFTLSGGPAPSNTNATGIHIGRNNVTIRNGRISNFYMGVRASGYYNSALIENLTLDNNKHIGISLYAEQAVIQNNTIINTGPSTYVSNADSYGIHVDGADITVFNNTVIGVTSAGTGRASGIATSSAGHRSIISHNVISNIESPNNFDSGIWFEAATLNHIASDNRITNPGSYGIAFDGGATGTYMNNLVDGSGISDYANGTAAGTTNY